MELDITRFFLEARMIDYSASAHEIGQDAGRQTWQRAMDDATEWNILDSKDALAAFRSFVLSTGGWDAEECEAMTAFELEALAIQFLAGEIRESFPSGTDALTDKRWQGYYTCAKNGNCPGRLSRDDKGRVYWNIQ